MNIRLSNLNHRYIQIRSPSLLAIENLDLEIQSGEFAALIGPSGCGKSTILRILAGLMEASSGEVWLDDLAPAQATSRASMSGRESEWKIRAAGAGSSTSRMTRRWRQ